MYAGGAIWVGGRGIAGESGESEERNLHLVDSGRAWCGTICLVSCGFEVSLPNVFGNAEGQASDLGG